MKRAMLPTSSTSFSIFFFIAGHLDKGHKTPNCMQGQGKPPLVLKDVQQDKQIFTLHGRSFGDSLRLLMGSL